MRLSGAPPRRAVGLAPLIDVVFLLLIFFMLAARFGADTAIPLALGGGEGATYSGPPRLVDVGPDIVRLNGVAIPEVDLAEALAPLVREPDDIIVLRAQDGADVQRLVDMLRRLGEAGLTGATIIE